MQMRENDFCECDHAQWRDSIEDRDGVLFDRACGKPILCELYYLSGEDDYHAATQIHIDYVVCDKHINTAVDNVGNRTYE